MGVWFVRLVFLGTRDEKMKREVAVCHGDENWTLSGKR